MLLLIVLIIVLLLLYGGWRGPDSYGGVDSGAVITVLIIALLFWYVFGIR